MALSFLATKSWNPTNTRNQKELYIAQQKEEARLNSELEKALEIKKELKLEEERKLNPNYVQDKRLNFLYEKPPGFVEKKKKTYLETFDPDGVNEDGLDEAVKWFKENWNEIDNSHSFLPGASSAHRES